MVASFCHCSVNRVMVAADTSWLVPRNWLNLTHALAIHFENEEESVMRDGTGVLGNRSSAIVVAFRSLDRGSS